MNACAEEPGVIRLGNPRRPWYLSDNSVRTWAEAAAVCLDECNHAPGVEMTVRGFADILRVRVEAPVVTDSMRRTHRNLKPAAEQGAIAVVSSLIHDLTEDVFIEQSIEHSGIDYWLVRRGQGMLFQGKTRLEISGILRETKANSIARRIREKSTRLDRYKDESPAKIAIVEFSAPKAVMEDHD
jgi:hypothetical protein